jgi:hypothetical protein
MLFGPWMEKKPSGGEDWVVELPEDSPDAFEIILPIVHTQPHALPGDVPFSQFLDTILLADKYDFREVMSPWIRCWPKDRSNREYLEELKPHEDEFAAAMIFTWDWGFQEQLDSLLENVVRFGKEQTLRELRRSAGFCPRFSRFFGNVKQLSLFFLFTFFLFCFSILDYSSSLLARISSFFFTSLFPYALYSFCFPFFAPQFLFLYFFPFKCFFSHIFSLTLSSFSFPSFLRQE